MALNNATTPRVATRRCNRSCSNSLATESLPSVAIVFVVATDSGMCNAVKFRSRFACRFSRCSFIFCFSFSCRRCNGVFVFDRTTGAVDALLLLLLLVVVMAVLVVDVGVVVMAVPKIFAIASAIFAEAPMLASMNVPNSLSSSSSSLFPSSPSSSSPWASMPSCLRLLFFDEDDTSFASFIGTASSLSSSSSSSSLPEWSPS
mmetsp:Transcript_8176/g.23496  ORF Transcript_8176/g.23496 Transcript_8176/m.23496 type:complete len:203 (+) Transcript_8176:435-1043(+)